MDRLTTTARANVCSRLAKRRTEIEQVLVARVHSISDPYDTADPSYPEGLRMAVSTALDYCLAAIEMGDGDSPPIPLQLLTQARVAARNRVGLETVLRRYLAGHALLEEFVVKEVMAEGADLLAALLHELVKIKTLALDRLVAATTKAYREEIGAVRRTTPAERRAQQVKRLLSGEMVDPPDLAYDFGRHHIGVIITGANATGTAERLAQHLDCDLLSVSAEQHVWAWLGIGRGADRVEIEKAARCGGSDGQLLAIGEIGDGLSGWRLTHRQATAAMQVARRRPDGVALYGEVALVASVLRDDLLAASLQELFLARLEDGRSGPILRETLRAYLAAENNVSSAAAALGVNRHTVRGRLRSAEERLGRPLGSCLAELDIALRMADLSVRPPG